MHAYFMGCRTVYIVSASAMFDIAIRDEILRRRPPSTITKEVGTNLATPSGMIMLNTPCAR
jgi:hypothetical protein